MTYRVWADVFAADAELGQKFQPFTTNKNLILKGIRTKVLFYNTPTITSFKGEIWTDDGGALGYKVFESSAVSAGSVITEANGVKEFMLDFSGVPLNGSTTYNFVLSGTGYSYSASSYLAWVNYLPEPLYQTNLAAPDRVKANTYPYYIYFIGAEY